MKRYVTLFLMTIVALNMWAQHTDYRKMSALVRRAAVAADKPSARRAAGNDTRVITAFVQTTDDSVLDRYGCRKYAQLDDIAIATIPLRQLKALASHPAVLRIEAGQSSQPLMDTVPTISNISPVYESTAQHRAFTGKGVVVGLMDIGFDLTHPNFYNNKTMSRYRIGAIWDMLSKDTIDSQLPVGRDYVGEREVLMHQCSTDGATESHGTHTLGIAAGSGFNSNYRGVAYESDICLVSNAVSSDIIYIDSVDYYKYTTATDALGFKYLFDYAQQHNKPCVASFSEGYTAYLDEDDRLFAEFLEKLTGPGRIIVVAAGNENRALTYAEKPKDAEVAGAFIRCYNKGALYRLKADGPVNIKLYAYGQGSTPSHTIAISSTDERLDSLLTDTLFFNTDTCAVCVSRYPSEFKEGEDIFLLQLNANRNIDQLPKMALTAESTVSRVEIYGSYSSALENLDTDPRWNAATQGHNILAPAFFPAVICVGGTTHRVAFTNSEGERIDASATQHQGRRMNASSTGPAMNGLMKPDVTAPGYNIISSFSSFYMANEPSNYFKSHVVKRFMFLGRDYYWVAESGTSMSCPVVAGIIALWLQANPTLTRQQIIDVFSRTCKHPDTSLSYPNNEYGYGEIDAYRGLLDILGTTSIQELSSHQPEGVRILPVTGGLRLIFNDPSPTTQHPSPTTHHPSPTTYHPTPITVSIYSLTGTRLYQETLTVTSQEMTLQLPPLSAGVYAVQLNSSEQHFTGSALVRM